MANYSMRAAAFLNVHNYNHPILIEFTIEDLSGPDELDLGVGFSALCRPPRCIMQALVPAVLSGRRDSAEFQ